MYTGFLVPGVSLPRFIRNQKDRLMLITIPHQKTEDKEEKKPVKNWSKIIVFLSIWPFSFQEFLS